MQISQQGKDFIKGLEGVRLKAYLDNVGIPTIGYGNTTYTNGNKVKLGDTITKEQADSLFDKRIKIDSDAISNSLNTDIRQNQFDALCSIRYNSGSLGRKDYIPTLWDRFLKGTLTPDFIQNYLVYNKQGVLNKGLQNRRQAESCLFFCGKYK